VETRHFSARLKCNVCSLTAARQPATATAGNGNGKRQRATNGQRNDGII
jgi:hypothetical protein